MDLKQLWELTINTAGDSSKTMLTLNGELIEAAAACLVMEADKPLFLDVKIPIYNGNLIVKTDATKPVDQEIVEVIAKKD